MLPEKLEKIKGGLMVEFILGNFDVIAQILLGVVVLANIIVNGTKTPKSGTWLGKIYRLIDWMALNLTEKAKDKG